MNRSGILIHQDEELTEEQEKKLLQYTEELLHGRPVQYVLSKAWFMGMPFFVDERVLIPRPETEELVDLVKTIYHHCVVTNEKLLLADIGTGSGCIAIALKKNFPAFEVWGIDNSQGALEVASINAKKLDTPVTFEKNNILIDDDGLPVFDIIVSNPPYIPLKDKLEMDSVVLDHEPHIALFVENEDPLKFYKAILTFSDHHLKRGGMIFFETHGEFANNVASLMEQFDFENVEIKKDIYGKDRIVFGRKSGASL
jgi:release factor glutamine methyltransferase